MRRTDRIDVPSGGVFESNDIALLQKANEAGSIVYRDKPFKLKSGIESNVYVFCRGDITSSPILLDMIGRKIACTVAENTARGDHRPNLIGLPTAGTALAVAASMASVAMQEEGPNFPLIASSVMREQLKKTHGANNLWVNGETSGPPNLDKFTFWTVDNVATDGETKFEAAKRLEEDGYPSKDMPQVIFIDRQQGAVARLKTASFKRVVVCYNMLDITFVYGELGIWPKAVVKLVEKEIADHQFL
ncbi:MAG: hypothetical protein Q7R58_02835 [bacterium]|nr:hypothetical protein [bacterium]